MDTVPGGPNVFPEELEDEAHAISVQNGKQRIGPRTPRQGRSIENDHPFNIDAQDAQENQDGRLLHERQTPAMIANGFADVQDYKPAVSR